MAEKLLYITGNPDKIAKAEEQFTPYGIIFEAKCLALADVKGPKLDEMTLQKAKTAYELVRRDLIVNNSGWSITALRGFPGPFMREMNEWLLPEDFLKLMSGHTDRSVFLENIICYAGQETTKLFVARTAGKVLYESRGVGKSSDTVISLSPDGKSIAELHNEGVRVASHSEAYDAFAQWYIKKR